MGAAQSGKTSLASAFVNNFAPSVYTQTNDPVLYYKTMSLSVGKDGPDAEREAFPMLVEVEDTYASERTEGEDCYGRRLDLDYFLGLFSTKRDHTKWSSEASGPPQLFQKQIAPKPHKYNPVSKIRMSFLIVFDTGDEQSFMEAIRVHSKLLEALQKERDILGKSLAPEVSPVIFLVGNKADRGVARMEYIQADAKQYAADKGIEDQLFFVSALELKKVKELFRKVLRKVHERQVLWDMGGSWRPKPSPLKQMTSMHHAVFESGQRAMASSQAAMKAGQENCGVQ